MHLNVQMINQRKIIINKNSTLMENKIVFTFSFSPLCVLNSSGKYCVVKKCPRYKICIRIYKITMNSRYSHTYGFTPKD